MRWIAAFSVALVLGLAIASTTRAAPDASSVRRKAVRAWRAREKAYLEGLGDRLTQVYQEWTAKRRLWASDPDAYKDEVVPLDGLRELFDAYVALQEEANERDRTFAACGDPKVLPTLFKDLLDLAKAIDATEAQIASSNPSGSGGRYPVEPVIRRHGQAARLRGLVEAIAAVPASSTFLAGPGLVKAAKGDRKRSTVRRSALLDCLGRIGDEPARAKLLAMLEAPQPFLRIVGLENLCGLGAGVVERLSPRLADPSPAVRRALLDAVRERAADVPAWIPVLVPALEGVRGTERVRLIRALEALTGEPLGDRPPAWIQWLEGHRTAIEDGSFVRLPPPEEKESAKGKEGENGKKDRGGEAKAPGARDGAEEGEAKPKPAAGPPVPPAITFYGVPSPSADLVFVLAGSTEMDLPADLETQTSRADSFWLQTGPKWKREIATHTQVLLEQLEATLAALPKDARFAVVHLHGSTPAQMTVLGARKALAPTKGTRKSVLRAVAKPKPYGHLSCQEGLWQAFDLCGLDPFTDPKKGAVILDTVYLLGPGWNGGRYPLPEVLRAAFERRNRFRRLTIHAIRICDLKEEAERLLKGLAETSGGTYHWLTEPP